MIRRWRKRKLRPKTMGVLLAKLILSGATDLAAQTAALPNVNPATPRAVIYWQAPQK